MPASSLASLPSSLSALMTIRYGAKITWCIVLGVISHCWKRQGSRGFKLCGGAVRLVKC